MPKPIETVKIKVEWLGWNYGRSSEEHAAYWLPEGEETYEARVTPKRYIVHYGSGNVCKLLRRFSRHDGTPKSKWHDYYGSHDRLSRTKLIFTLITP